MAFSPSLRSSANVHTRIKSLFRTCIENNYLIKKKSILKNLRQAKYALMYMYFPHSVRKVPSFYTHARANSGFRPSFCNSYFRYKCEKVILSSCGRLHPSEARVMCLCGRRSEVLLLLLLPKAKYM